MYALLGDIQFDLITYFNGFECIFGADYAEHAMIDGKPRLQSTGLALDEIQITLAFHNMFCEPESELVRLKNALTDRHALALVLGNGDYKGWFVITAVTATAQQTDSQGTITALEASMTLREYTGDPANPLPPPAVKPEDPPVQAVAQPPAPPVAVPEAGGNLHDNISAAVSMAVQAQGALRLASDVVAMASRLRDNPLAALSRVSGIMSSLDDVLSPLENLPASLSIIRNQIPAASEVLSAGNSALTGLMTARATMESASASNVVGKIDSVTGLLDSAGTAMSTVSSGLGKAAGQLVTRSV